MRIAGSEKFGCPHWASESQFTSVSPTGSLLRHTCRSRFILTDFSTWPIAAGQALAHALIDVSVKQWLMLLIR
jgi:hypothetical protein